MTELEQLKAQVQALKDEHAAMRRRRLAWVVVAGIAASLWGAVAFAAGNQDCTVTFPFALNCFAPNRPAVATEINFNDYTLATRIQTVEANAGTLAARVAALEARSGTLELKVDGDGGVGIGLVKLPRVQSGYSPHAACGQTINSPCNVTFPYAFRSAPRCAAMAQTPDTTGYNENPVLTGVSTTGISVWKGQYPGTGVTMGFYWVCVEP